MGGRAVKAETGGRKAEGRGGERLVVIRERYAVNGLRSEAVEVSAGACHGDGMRLSAQDRAAIREEVARRDSRAAVYLFGSRTNDAARGGDIDLLVISGTLGFRDVLRLRLGILDRIGWQQLDLVVRRPDELQEPLAASALASGVRL